MTKVDIISGFLGAGKTTLISKLLKEALKGEQVVLIENEFGEIGIDGGFLKDSGVEIREMNSGCICCSLVGDFGTSLKEVVDKYHPDRIIIEPSGVGKLSDVIKAVKDLHIENEIVLNSASTVADASKVKVYMKNFGEFFNNQIEHAGTVILSRTQNVSEEKLKTAIELIKSVNPNAHIITTPWDDIDGTKILGAMENVTNLELDMLAEAAQKAYEEHEKEHHHHHHEHRGLGDIFPIIDRCEMTDTAKELAKHIFRILAKAEAKAHNVPEDQVHVHEGGAVDSIVDIVAAAVCRIFFYKKRLQTSPNMVELKIGLSKTQRGFGDAQVHTSKK